MRPCRAAVRPLANGGIKVSLFVPGYDGELELSLSAEMQEDGEGWRVYIPWPEAMMHDDPAVIGDDDGHNYNVLNGIIYVGRDNE
jgi:hypothetical protein